MQDLTSWGINDHEEGEGSAQNYTAGPGQGPEESWDHSLKENQILQFKSCSARKVPLLKPVHVHARLKFANDHLDDPEQEWEKVMWSDETKIYIFGLNSTRRVWMKKDEYNPKNIKSNFICHIHMVSRC